MATIAAPHLAGAAAPKHSTFADANRGRDARMFSNLFSSVTITLPRSIGRKTFLARLRSRYWSKPVRWRLRRPHKAL
jgi:hypothetical protein